MRKKIIALVLGGLIAGSTLLPLAACTDKTAKLPVWDSNVTISKEGASVKWEEVEGAKEYKVYHSPSRFGTYTLESTQATRTYTNADKYGYYRVDAIDADGKEISSEVYSYELDTFGANVHIYASTDDQAAIQADVDRFKNATSQFAGKEIYEYEYETDENGEYIRDKDGRLIEKSRTLIGEGRYAGLFKEGTYDELNLQLRYYMTFSGLGYTPTDAVLGGFFTNGELSNGNATCNFWCGIENLTINSEVQWAVSQATSFRRMQVNGNMHLYDNRFATGNWASGGYISDTVVTGTIDGSVQQQWFTRNSQFKTWRGCDINMVFAGCTGSFVDKTYAWPSKRVTELETTRTISEKPYLVFDNGYEVCLPALKSNSKGVSWKSGDIDENDEYIPLSNFYVARSDRDNSKTINAALKNGKHILFTPGIYEIDSPIIVENKNTIVMGIGLASLKLTEKNTDTIMRVGDVDGVKISGVIFDAGPYSETLLQLGDKKSSVRHEENPTVLNDVYFRIGGAGSGATSVDTTLEINSNDVVGDNFWVWRADHGNSGTVGWDINKTINGVIVNGDHVTIYGLMVEHFHEYQTIWNGEYGFMAFYQSETPYDPPEQDEWMSEWKGVEYQGWASYKVADSVQNHEAYGIGVYYVASSRLRNVFTLDHAIELPSNAGIHIEHMAIANFLSYGDKKTNGGIRHIVNEYGKSNFDGSKNQWTSFIAGEATN